MNIINIRIKSQNDNANRTGPKKRKRAVMRKGWPRMMITVSTKSLLLGWMSISIWCDQNLLSCSSFFALTPVCWKMPLNQTLEERVGKQVICRFTPGSSIMDGLSCSCYIYDDREVGHIISPHAKSLEALLDFKLRQLSFADPAEGSWMCHTF